VLFTVVVVLSEKVETTVQKGIFRALGTVIGGAPFHASVLLFRIILKSTVVIQKPRCGDRVGSAPSSPCSNVDTD